MKTVLTLLALCLPLFAWGAKVPNLYDVSVPVSNQSSAELKRASRLGLAEVIIRVAGTPEVLDNSTIANGLRSSEKYLKRFSYRQESEQGVGQELLVEL